jgi:hypothetical protein
MEKIDSIRIGTAATPQAAAAIGSELGKSD